MGPKQQAVSYPQLLDKTGKDLVSSIEEIKRDSLKPAIMADIAGAFNAIFWIQQLLTMSYNLQVQNYEITMKKVVAVETKLQDLETRLAGYSERLDALEKYPKPLDEEGLIRLIQENSKLREIIKNIG